MGQNVAKKALHEGEILHSQQRFDEAIEEWKKALKRLKNPAERFVVSGKICTALCDVGKYREALAYAGQQCEAANTQGDVALKAEAFYNLAACNERSCEFSKAISYCRQSQLLHTERSPFSGYAHLCMGGAYLGTSEFLKAWKSFVSAMDEAKATGDKVLQSVTCAKMGALFCHLGDYDSCIAYCTNSLDLLDDLMDDDPNLKYKRQVTVQSTTAVRKMGRYTEAMDACEDAMQLAMKHSDRPAQARCLNIFADIHRKRNDIERAIPRYESSMSIMSEIGDRLGQVEVLSGMAKTAACQRNYLKATELNEKALELASKIGCKFDAAGDGICRTNNISEGWLHGLQSLLQRNHPNLWRFIGDLQLDCVKQHHSFLQVVTGVEQPAEKRYRTLRDRLEILKCHARLKVLSEVQGDMTLGHRHTEVIKQLVQEMDLFCGVCGDIIGQTPERLEPLNCGHFVHSRCAVHLARSTLGRGSKRRPCPACRGNTSLNPVQSPT